MEPRLDSSFVNTKCSWYKSALKVLNCTRFESTDFVKSSTIDTKVEKCNWASLFDTNSVALCFSNSKKNSFGVYELNGIDSEQNLMQSNLCQIVVDTPIVSASLFQDKAVLGLKDGRLIMYSIRDSFQKWIFDGKMQIELPCQQSLLSMKKDRNLFTKYFSDEIGDESHKFCFDLELNKLKLLTAVDEVQMVWDLQVPQAPIHNFFLDSLVLTCRWNFLCPEILAAGTFDGKVHVCDTRMSELCLTFSESDSDTIKTVAWSPLVPHWIATAGDNSVVYVWDLRNTKNPMRKLYSHINYVNCLAWSPRNADFLASGGSDNKTQIWNIRLEPHYALPSLPTSSSSVISVNWLDTDIFSIMSVSNTGIIDINTLNRKCVSELAPSVDNNEEINYSNVRKLIYSRNFKLALSKANLLAQKYLAQKRIEEARELLKMCLGRYPFESVASYNINNFLKFQDELQTSEFNDELHAYSSFIPYNYPAHLWPQIDEELLKNIQITWVTATIELAVMKNCGKDIILVKNDIIDVLKDNISFLNFENLLRIFSVIVPYNYIAALEFAIELCDVYKNSLDNFIKFFNYLLFPTIFDSKKSITKLHEKILCAQGNSFLLTYFSKDRYKGITYYSKLLHVEIDSSLLISQFELLRNFYIALWGSKPKNIFSKLHFDYESLTSLPSVSECAWMIYFNAALLYKKFDKFYIYASHLIAMTKEDNNFMDNLASITDEVNAGAIDYWENCHLMMDYKLVKSYDSNNQSDPAAIINSLLRASNMVVKILCNSNINFIPSDFLSLLVPALTKILSSIKSQVDALNDYSRLTMLFDVAEKKIAQVFAATRKSFQDGKHVDAINQYRELLDECLNRTRQ